MSKIFNVATIKKTYKHLYLCMVFGILSCANVLASNVSVISWNTFLLDTPDPLGIDFGPQCEGNDCKRRAREIVEKVMVENVDIANLQEVWEQIAIDEMRPLFINYGYHYHTWDKESGLFTASKYPISNVYFEEYLWDHGFFGDGLDDWKDKGFLAMDILTPDGKTIKVINTHLDAGNSDCEDKYTRLNQLFQLKAYTDQQSNAKPILLSGDFNINVKQTKAIGLCNSNESDNVISQYGFDMYANAAKSQYQILKQIMEMPVVHELLDTTLSATSTGSSKVIDYYLTKNHSNNLNFNQIRTLSQFIRRSYCYIFEEYDYGQVTYSNTECYSEPLTSYELYELNQAVNPDGAVYQTADLVETAQSDHNPVRLDLIVN